MAPVSSKKIVSCGVSTDTRFISHPALVASAHRVYLTSRASLNLMVSIMMIRIDPTYKSDLYNKPRMSGAPNVVF